MALLRAVGRVQARLLMLLLFVVLVIPIGFARRMTSDPMKLSAASKGWTVREKQGEGRQAAERQY